MKKMRSLSHHELRSLAALCAGTSVLLAVAVFFAGPPTTPTYNAPASLTASTWLGQQQGIPAYDGGYPKPLNCYDSGASQVIRNYNNNPDCNTGSYIAVFSLHKASDNFGETHAVQTAGMLGGGPNGGGTPLYNYVTYGNSVTAEPGEPVVLEWSCQPSQVREWTRCQGLGCYNTNNFGATDNYFGGSNMGSGELVGSQTIPAPDSSTSFTFSCSGTRTVTTDIPLTIVQPTVNPPTISITGNGTNPATVALGSSVVIQGAFSADPHDSLTETALNDYQNNSLSGVAWTPPGTKTYTFTPTAMGTYMFYPAVRSTYFPGWNNYGASLLVTVTAAPPPGTCAGGQTNPPTCSTCATGFINNSGGTCVVDPSAPSDPSTSGACAGAHQINPPTCSCASGYAMQGGVCVAGTCSGAHQIDYPSCSCDVGYVMQAGACVEPEPSISTALTATPTRVVRGQSTVLNWSTTGMAPNACTLRDGSGIVLSNALSSAGLSVVVTTQNTFTLSCVTSGPTLSSSATVTVVPSYIEL